MITEVGGTIGDIEGQPFIEAIRQVGLEEGKDNVLYIHVTLVPYLHGSNEHKTKPTQHSVKELQGMGIHPDIIVLRSDEPIEDSTVFRKVAMFCNVQPECVFENRTLQSIYECPLMLEEQNFSAVVCRRLGLPDTPEPELEDWRAMADSLHRLSRRVRIALVGKYVQLHDAYLSVMEALRHAGFAAGAEIDIDWIDSESVTEENCSALLEHADGILIPGGFGNRGIGGKILAARYARENGVPFLGLCLGMQIAVIEFARNVAGLTGADSREFNEASPHRVIDFMPGQSDEIDKGGTLRLGAYECLVQPGSMLEKCYGAARISERHRHRYEFNNEYREVLTSAGLAVGGLSPDGMLVETVEIPEHPFYIGVQYHPEFKSRPNRPHPLFRGFVAAALAGQKGGSDPCAG